jgi:hypothetical protein
MEKEIVLHEMEKNVTEIVNHGSRGLYSIFLKRTGAVKKGG